MEFNVIIEKDEDGWYVARVPEIQGCHTQGKTIQEALERIKCYKGIPKQFEKEKMIKAGKEKGNKYIFVEQLGRK